ncbi:hypothetical protein DFH07DRAFT_874309 [Mycena maculata]|uniref:NAD(P)-binding protein n=1 Tax=Mycena maculata TaxID=230809 RepID=A0AAD7KET3_9AGAR|nr:hypothetical protein DFH07DRAFT_874309 [Mycena maculata]
MSRLIAFIIGSGANVGQHTAAALKAKGYQVALGSRKPAVEQTKKDGYFPVTVDGTSSESIKTAFAQINQELGPPNVVVFNVATFTRPPVPEDPLTLSVESFTEQAAVGLSVFAAAQEAVAGFRSAGMHKDTLRTFIVTGNPLPFVPVDRGMWTPLSVQKLIEWRLVALFAASYAKEGIRFYFATAVSETGGILEPLSQFFTSGPQHAEVYTDLATRADYADWDYRFTLKGQQWKE